jgi:hypothetical protein
MWGSDPLLRCQECSLSEWVKGFDKKLAGVVKVAHLSKLFIDNREFVTGEAYFFVLLDKKSF